MAPSFDKNSTSNAYFQESEMLLAYLRRLVMRRGSLQERLAVLHSLAKTANNHNVENEWMNDVATHEKSRCDEIDDQLRSLDLDDATNESSLNAIHVELSRFTHEAARRLHRQIQQRVQDNLLNQADSECLECASVADTTDSLQASQRTLDVIRTRLADEPQWEDAARAQQVLQRLGMALDDLAKRLYQLDNAEQFHRLLAEMQATKPRETAFPVRSFSAFDKACQAWHNRVAAGNDPPTHLRIEAESLFAYRRQVKIKQIVFGGTCAALVLLISVSFLAHTINVRAQGYNAAAAFVSAVESQDWSLADVCYEKLEKDHHSHISDAKVVAAVRKRQARIAHQQQWDTLDQQCTVSIDQAKKIPSELDDSCLDNTALAALGKLAKTSEEQTRWKDLDDQYATIENRAAEQRFDALELLCVELIDKAETTPVAAVRLDITSLAKLRQISRTNETQERVKSLEKQYAGVRQKTEERVAEEGRVQKVTNALAEAQKAINDTNTAAISLKRAALSKASELLGSITAVTSNEKDDLKRLQQELAVIYTKIIEAERKQVEADLAAITAAVGNFPAYRNAVQEFVNNNPSDPRSLAFSTAVNFKGDALIATWNDFVQQYGNLLDQISTTAADAKKVEAFITANENRLAFLPAFAMLKSRHEFYRQWARGDSPLVKMSQSLDGYLAKELWFCVAARGEYYYFIQEPTVGENTTYTEQKLQNSLPAKVRFSEDELCKVTEAPQLSLARSLKQQLDVIAENDKRNDLQKYYASLMSIFQEIRHDAKTDPIVLCVILKDFVTVLVPTDPFIATHANEWLYALHRNTAPTTQNSQTPAYAVFTYIGDANTNGVVLDRDKVCPLASLIYTPVRLQMNADAAVP